MKRTQTTLATYLVLVLFAGPSFAAPRDGDSSSPLYEAFSAHCVRCHGKGGRAKGKVDLLALQSDQDLHTRPALLEKLITVLKDREMPPEDEPTLPTKKREEMLTHLQATLDEALKTQAFIPTPIRRMNRFQYNNAVVDLLELDRDIFGLNERLLRRRDDYFRPETRTMPAKVRVSSRPLAKDVDNERPEGFRGVASFPQDKRAEHGFDNRADHLTLSPLLMESFLQLSQTIVASPDLNPGECRSWDRLFARPGQPARVPTDGRYEAETAGLVRIVGRTRGRSAPQVLGSGWSGDTQLFWRCRKESEELKVSFDLSVEGSGLFFRFTRAHDYGTFDLYLDDVKISEKVDLYDLDLGLTDHEVQGLEIDPGPHTLRFKCVGKRKDSLRHFFGLDYFDVTGRKLTADSDAAVVSDIDAIRSRLRKFLRRAFRRPPDPETLDRFGEFAERQLVSGASFEETMRTLVGAVLGMPDFLYSFELPGTETSLDRGGGNTDNPDSGRQRVGDFELASRLSQFFWSSIPDDTLLDLAEMGSLSERETLSAQIDRMLNDRRSSRFCDNFPAQWLQLDRLITSIPDPQKFPHFYYDGYRSSIHMMSEPLLLFESVYIEDRSILELLDPKFTWRSRMLRANYDGHSKAPQDVQIQTFERVPLNDPRQGGVITNLAIMTMTSTPTRTQPITRGAWVNAVIFNDPPEPPPADVPPLPEVDAEKLEKLTIRERLAEHRKRADCAGCHNKIDPLGFALENYDPTGVWRDKYENGREVDPGGVLFNQLDFQTAVEFKRLILQERKRFIRGFSAHLLSYALGRELGPADSPALDDMTAKAMAGQNHLRAVLKSVAMSEPFLHKSVNSPARPREEPETRAF